MQSFRWWAPAVGLAAVALLALRAGNTDLSGTRADERLAGVGCQGGISTRCMVEIWYAYPAADLSVVPADVYF